MPSPEQQRVLDIASFREELARLEREGVTVLDPQTSEQVRAHQDAVLASLADLANVDLTPADAKLSVGMRIATLLGAAALSAAYGFYVSSAWATLPLMQQLLVVTVPSLILVMLTHLTAVREPSGYVASVFAAVAVIALWIGLVAIGSLFNLPDTRNLLLAVGVFALTLAYMYSLGLPLLLGVVAIGGWCWSLVGIPLGLFWRDGFVYLDPVAVLGLVYLMMPRALPRPAAFGGIWRTVGAAAFGASVVVLGMNARLSLLDGSVDPQWIEVGYQALAVLAFPLLMVLGVRKEWTGVTAAAVVCFVLLLVTRLDDWFWTYLPKWLFFLLVGLLALLVLLLLRQLRARKAVVT